MRLKLDPCRKGSVTQWGLYARRRPIKHLPRAASP